MYLCSPYARMNTQTRKYCFKNIDLPLFYHALQPMKRCSACRDCFAAWVQSIMPERQVRKREKFNELHITKLCRFISPSVREALRITNEYVTAPNARTPLRHLLSPSDIVKKRRDCDSFSSKRVARPTSLSRPHVNLLRKLHCEKVPPAYSFTSKKFIEEGIPVNGNVKWITQKGHGDKSQWHSFSSLSLDTINFTRIEISKGMCTRQMSDSRRRWLNKAVLAPNDVWYCPSIARRSWRTTITHDLFCLAQQVRDRVSYSSLGKWLKKKRGSRHSKVLLAWRRVCAVRSDDAE